MLMVVETNCGITMNEIGNRDHVLENSHGKWVMVVFDKKLHW